MFCKDEELNHELFYSHNFGHKGELEFHGLGINAKMSELQAAMGLAVLPYIQEIIESRKEVAKVYDKNLNFEKLKKLVIREGTEWNYSYYPIIFESEKQLLKVQKALNKEQIFPRRYFYPSLNTLEYVEFSEMKNSEDISKRVLCLPLYESLQLNAVREISGLINNEIN